MLGLDGYYRYMGSGCLLGSNVVPTEDNPVTASSMMGLDGYYRYMSSGCLIGSNAVPPEDSPVSLCVRSWLSGN